MLKADSMVGAAPTVLVEGDPGRERPLGLADDAFEQRRPVRGQITKSEVRAVSLYALGLRLDSIVWDIGAGTGSVAVEAARIAYRGQVYAVDKDVESAGLLESNVARYGDGRVNITIGAAPEILRELPDPDSVFIGGGGIAMPQIIAEVVDRLRPGGRVVANFAAMERANATYQAMKQASMSPQLTMVAASRGRELPDETLRLEAMNPVFVVWGQK
ncbi:MAG: precorrin-6Y C5,15-methyltransferase (decarboxylating) subunit CbiT [Chloroflexota bacterium]|nr:precorrin-6Y C5,15-methyltransferase (decarboxylating) subunit CbiT [Chloroflexota bacterium]MDE2683732.1 precorrin-6Y C5,15-methyltransferase (decarboxylating) subunit CbiT [Chloroflexota bacterium]